MHGEKKRCEKTGWVNARDDVSLGISTLYMQLGVRYWKPTTTITMGLGHKRSERENYIRKGKENGYCIEVTVEPKEMCDKDTG